MLFLYWEIVGSSAFVCACVSVYIYIYIYIWKRNKIYEDGNYIKIKINPLSVKSAHKNNYRL